MLPVFLQLFHRVTAKNVISEDAQHNASEDPERLLMSFHEVHNESHKQTGKGRIKDIGQLGIVATGLYLFSPLDIIPDFMVLFGLADDLAVLLLASREIGRASCRERV